MIAPVIPELTILTPSKFPRFQFILCSSHLSVSVRLLQIGHNSVSKWCTTHLQINFGSIDRANIENNRNCIINNWLLHTTQLLSKSTRSNGSYSTPVLKLRSSSLIAMLTSSKQFEEYSRVAGRYYSFAPLHNNVNHSKGRKLFEIYRNAGDYRLKTQSGSTK